MKKLVLSGLIALGLTLAGGEKASAWVNFKFGVGANIDWQSGGNNLLWGAFRGDQVPGPEAYGHHGGFGPQFAPGMPLPAAPEAKTSPAQPTYWYGGNPYHAVGYSPYSNPYYSNPYQNSTYYLPMQYGR